MKNSTRLVPFTIIAFTVLLSFAWAPAPKGCHKINAKAEGEVTFQHRESISTEADIIGGGLLNGTTMASFALSSSGMFTGFLEITTKHGSLEFRVINGFVSGAEFRATAVVIEGSGTGKLRGATGELLLEGITINEEGDFTQDITGEICFN